ncbi:TIGR02757 family protein [Compostibacter hankyongensis]|uniref:TIGR02757 family protein n=1 Tax=Compostibacter hankyongensis TaxID=1007089 RepID=A0ABP8FE42_9BACT
MEKENLTAFLNRKTAQYNQPLFIPGDPVSIPHRFTRLQDREISGFFAAILAWGNRSTIIKNCLQLMDLMDDAPHDFMLGHRPEDLKRFLHFKHRTFNATDLLYFIDFLSAWYRSHSSLETAFSRHLQPADPTVEKALTGFHTLMFAREHPARTRKHIATPARNSACKRLNMFLRWMVRKDKCGVDFGCWKNIRPAQLVCPLDIHVSRTAQRLGLLHTGQTNWKAALALTDELRKFDPADPAKYDFALFGLGVIEKFI